MEDNLKNQRVLIFIISYNHETLLMKVLERIPESLHTDYPNVDFEILIIDDCSKDNTFKNGYEFLKTYNKFKTVLLSNPINQQFGGNQKIGYQYAIDHNFDHVVLLHGDGQYAPEMIPTLIAPLLNHEADAVFGSRMMNSKDALKGGMPYYKWVGNKILTKAENYFMRSNLTEWHSGFRLYSVNTLKKIPFQYNSNYYDFDTQIIIQVLGQGLKIKELPIPTFYGDEECNVDGFKYARKIILACMLFKVQDWGIFYHPCFYLKDRYSKKPSKISFDSSTSRLINKIKDFSGKSLVILNSEEKDIKEYLQKEAMQAVIVSPDFDLGLLKEGESFDAVFFLDSFECVPNIESLLIALRESKRTQNAKYFATVANVGFLLTRIMLFFGQFNYGVRGILDFRHKRLFTCMSAKKLLENYGYVISKTDIISVPWKLVFRSKILVKVASSIWNFLLKISKGLFSYQYYFEFLALPSLEELLKKTEDNTEILEKVLEDKSK